MRARIAVLPGDGIGKEVTLEAIRCLEVIAKRFSHDFNFIFAEIGGQAIDNQGTALPEETVDICSASDAILLGAVGGPKWDDPKANVRPEQGILQLRKKFDLFANIRPIKVLSQLKDSSPLKKEVIENVDFIVIRELTGGLYFGKPSKKWDTSRGQKAVDTLIYSEKEIERVVTIAFEMAASRKKHLTSVDKANVLSSSRLWREVVDNLSKSFPEVKMEHMLVDSCAMHIIKNPRNFDVIVTENMFGDILTDEASVLTGSMGMMPSASLGNAEVCARKSKNINCRFGLYEPIHGSAPDIAGKGIANPIASILSAAMLLRHSLGLNNEATILEKAVESIINKGYRTADLCNKDQTPISTSDMGNLIAKEILTI